MISSSLHKAYKQLLAALLEVITSPCFPIKVTQEKTPKCWLGYMMECFDTVIQVFRVFFKKFLDT